MATYTGQRETNEERLVYSKNLRGNAFFMSSIGNHKEADFLHWLADNYATVYVTSKVWPEILHQKN